MMTSLRTRLLSILSPAEWTLAGKVIATLLMLYAVLLRAIYLGQPVERFIYGRF